MLKLTLYEPVSTIGTPDEHVDCEATEFVVGDGCIEKWTGRSLVSVSEVHHHGAIDGDCWTVFIRGQIHYYRRARVTPA